MNDTTPPSPAPARTIAKRRKWLIVTTLTLAVLTLLTVILLPIGIQYGLRNWLLENGGQRVQIADVDLNPFSGILRLEDVSINVDEHSTLSAKFIELDFAWLALLKEHFTLTSVHVSGIDIRIHQNDSGKLRIGGIIIPVTKKPDSLENGVGKIIEKEAESRWGIGVDSLRLSNISIHYTMPKLEIDTQIKQLSLQDLASWTPGKSAQLSLQATINGAPLTYDGGIAPFADTLHVDGHIDLRDLPLEGFRQIAAVADELKGKLSLQSDFDVSLGEKGIHAKLQTKNIQLDELLFSTKQIRLQQKALHWSGNIDFSQADKLRIAAVGDLSNQQLSASLRPQKLDISQQAFQTAVDFTFTSSKTDNKPGIIALLDKTQITELHVNADAFPLAGLKQLIINKLELRDPRSLAIQKMQMENLYVAKNTADKSKTGETTPALFKNGQLDIEELTLKGANALRISSISLKDADISLSRAKDGHTNLDTLLAAIENLSSEEAAKKQAATPSTDQPSPDKEQPDTPATFHIGHIQISDDSTIIIDDASTTPPTRIDISIESLSIDNLDNSSSNEVTKLAAKGKFGRFGSYTFTADAQPFSEKTNAKLVADIKGVDLPRLSPYTARDLDFRLRSGTLASDIDMAIAENQLSGKIQLVLHQLELIPLKEKKKGGEITATSLNTSLNMLRDKNNTITLDIPLSGDINAPDFSVQNAINQALMSGVKTGVMTYALLALQPYGTMVVVAKYAGEQIIKLRLDPVKFAPGSSEIDATAKDYLGKMAGILVDRPKVDIKVCGVATASDAAALTGSAKDKPPASDEASLKKLKELARQRSIAVREFLISKSGKAGHQLISCMPMVENSADALPRADLLI